MQPFSSYDKFDLKRALAGDKVIRQQTAYKSGHESDGFIEARKVVHVEDSVDPLVIVYWEDQPMSVYHLNRNEPSSWVRMAPKPPVRETFYVNMYNGALGRIVGYFTSKTLQDAQKRKSVGDGEDYIETLAVTIEQRPDGTWKVIGSDEERNGSQS